MDERGKYFGGLLIYLLVTSENNCVELEQGELVLYLSGGFIFFIYFVHFPIPYPSSSKITFISFFCRFYNLLFDLNLVYYFFSRHALHYLFCLI